MPLRWDKHLHCGSSTSNLTDSSKPMAPEQPDTKELTFVATAWTRVLSSTDSARGAGSQRCVLTRPFDYPKCRNEKCLSDQREQSAWAPLCIPAASVHKPLLSSRPWVTHSLWSGFCQERCLIWNMKTVKYDFGDIVCFFITPWIELFLKLII